MNNSEATILVSPDTIQQYQDESTFILLDVTMPVVGADPSQVGEKKIIPGAIRFDLEATFSNNNPFPHTMLEALAFTEKVQALGINQDSQIVVYDDVGLFSSPRVWWMFKAMGHNKVSILNGGLPVWLAAGKSTDAQHKTIEKSGDFSSKPQPGYFSTIKDINTAIENGISIVDARSAHRFYSRVDEPRPNLRRGNIPTSKNLPFQSIINEQGYLPKQKIQSAFQALNLEKDEPIIFSCGSGITACIDAVAARICGYTNVSVYDGSWCEWGTLVDG